jgi:hypothetical protein
MRQTQLDLFGATLLVGGLNDELVAELNAIYPEWRSDLRCILEDLSKGDDLELAILAQEALCEIEQWESAR